MLSRQAFSESTPATRRLFLRGLGGALAASAVAPGRVLAGLQEERRLSFVHTHTHERLTVPYFADGVYLPEGLSTLNSFLRDFRTGDEHPIDQGLFDVLHDLRLATGTKSPFRVISAFRSPRTNAMLREHGRGVATGSLHLQGTMDNASAYDDIGWNDYYDPNFWINRDGHVTADPTHMIKVQGTYVLPFDIALNVYYRGITGDAWTQRKRGPSLSQGRVTFNAEPAGKYHYPFVNTVDVRLVKEFTIASKYKLGLMFDVFNLLNDDSINWWGDRFNYDWWAEGNVNYRPSTGGHQLNGLVLPRRARVGLRFIF